MTTTTTTFVTAFIDIYKKPIEWRFDRFAEIASTGISICLYVDADLFYYATEFVQSYPNVKLMRTIDLVELDEQLFSKTQNINYILPYNRNREKDTEKYLIMMNSKTYYLNDAIQQNPWQSTHFAWIDFSISYIFKKMPETLNLLKMLSKSTYQSEPFLTLPGCWDKPSKSDALLDNVYWRFFGGFILGDKDSISNFYRLYKEHFYNFTKNNNRLVWEVNFWAWLECNTEFTPVWYNADHNDSIVNIPTKIYSLPLCNSRFITKTIYDYPKIDGYEPMQAAHLCYNGKHYLNTRYVNYRYSDSGYYVFNDKNRHIITKNLCTVLSADLAPGEFTEMCDNNSLLEPASVFGKCAIFGLEDIRLYEFDGKMRFIATNINYSPTGFNQMIVGNYLPDTASYSDCTIVKSPYNTKCEKNWIPITRMGEELFIYKWYPMEIGRLNSDRTQLEIVTTYPINAPDFHRVRGSTIFIDHNDTELIGVVHFSENTTPRQYYHMMVILDKNTLKPLKYSGAFHFMHIGIEFCTGFMIDGDDYVFWISKWDREPAMIRIRRSEILI